MSDRLADTELVSLLRQAADFVRLVEWDEQTGESANRRILTERDDLRQRLIAKANELEA